MVALRVDNCFNPILSDNASICSPPILPEFYIFTIQPIQTMAVPKKVAERLIAGVKHYQPILASAKLRDVGETDTVTIIKDMLVVVEDGYR